MDYNNIDSDDAYLLRLVNKYDNSGKYIKFGHINLNSECHQMIYKMSPDIEVTKVYFDDIDRGVKDWKRFEKILLELYPNIKYLIFNQNFGSNNFFETNIEYIIFSDSQSNWSNFKTSGGKFKKNIVIHKTNGTKCIVNMYYECELICQESHHIDCIFQKNENDQKIIIGVTMEDYELE